METIRAAGLQVGTMYRWALGDPEELFVVLDVPRFIDPVYPNYFKVLSNKFSRREMSIFASDKFFAVTQ